MIALKNIIGLRHLKMRLKGFKILLILLFLTPKNIYSQNIYTGQVIGLDNEKSLKEVEIYDFEGAFITKTDENGNFKFINYKNKIKLVLYKIEYNYKVLDLFPDNLFKKIFISPYSVELNEVTVIDKENKFSIEKLNDIVGNSIFAGKKTNKIILDNMTGDMSSNNARHVYNKIGGLNIFQNDDAGLQLNIGGRGLNPGRSANFNIRQNNYDISADVLGYPESYYSPPAEALKEIQIIRGAASLQYGTQFGGLVNFIFKKPEKFKKISLVARNSIGSNSLYTNFTSLSGKLKKVGYYTFINYKRGDGFRSNSNFESINLFSYFDMEIAKKLKASIEVTYLTYLAKQAGGLTDVMFYENPLQSNRERNWFKIDWLLYNSKISYKLNNEDNISLNLFMLDANRFALGYRNIRVDQIDPINERDLVKGFFNNYGFESRYLNKYKLLTKSAVILSGFKYYKSDNIGQQGPGSANYSADFEFYNHEYPFYPNQSYYNYPNLNTSFFLENIFYIDSSLSITPGLRYENIDTESNGYYRAVYLNLVNQPLYDTTIYNTNKNKRNFFLFGVGLSYKRQKDYEVYSNISQNYRSVTFSDITINSPTFLIDPNISDEKGYSYDVGFRGVYNSFLSFDFNYYGLSYNNRIGFLQKKIEFMPGFFTTKTQKGNIGDAFIYGIESLIDLYLKNIMQDVNLNAFLNYAYTKSEYIRSETESIVGNEVEFVPEHNLKSGLNVNFKRYMAAIQLTYLSDQFTEASNSIDSDISGILGSIPSYYILDFSSSIDIKKYKLFFGINNLTNKSYFTRRATGYPGPGIIPSQKRNYFITLEIKI